MTTKEMACHTWALSGNPDMGETINNEYTSLMDEIGENYGYGENLHGKVLVVIRQETMYKILKICEERKQKLTSEVYLCGGFREGQVCPEHLWLEDHTANKTYDTFVDQDVRCINKVGVYGKPFQPGCEEEPFKADEIARVRIDGYTDGQFNSLP